MPSHFYILLVPTYCLDWEVVRNATGFVLVLVCYYLLNHWFGVVEMGKMLVATSLEASILVEGESIEDFGLMENQGMVGMEKEQVGMGISIDFAQSKEVSQDETKVEKAFMCYIH